MCAFIKRTGLSLKKWMPKNNEIFMRPVPFWYEISTFFCVGVDLCVQVLFSNILEFGIFKLAHRTKEHWIIFFVILLNVGLAGFKVSTH
jgi:hypothetical protein